VVLLAIEPTGDAGVQSPDDLAHIADVTLAHHDRRAEDSSERTREYDLSQNLTAPAGDRHGAAVRRPRPLQMLCALLIFDGPDFRVPLGQISPWMDMCNQSVAAVWRTLAAQTHRRFIKTHTPLDAVPWRSDGTYLVVGRAGARDLAGKLEGPARLLPQRGKRRVAHAADRRRPRRVGPRRTDRIRPRSEALRAGAIARAAGSDAPELAVEIADPTTARGP
jgi:hypothetical protein